MKKILKKQKERQELMNHLLTIDKMVQGSFCQIKVKCGKKYCSCNKGELHPHWRMSMRRDGCPYSRAVPKKDHAWMREMTENYRNFRKICRQVKKLDREIMQLITAHEQKLVRKTSNQKSYLRVGN